MDVNLIDGNCGELCNYHCCRRTLEDGEVLGIYFLPHEYKTIQKEEDLIDPDTLQVHTKKHYDLPDGIKQLYYGYCKDSKNCIRDVRPIQCRTFPFVPHIEGNKLKLVIEKDQEHDCPLIATKEKWNPNFEFSILNGWFDLVKISQIEILIRFDSAERIENDNILYTYDDFRIVPFNIENNNI